MILGALATSLVVSAPALAADDSARPWEALYDARLVDAADGTPDVAAKFYEELLEDLGPNDPMRGPTCYWLGRARLESGDLDGAVESLKSAVDDSAMARAAETLLTQVELRQHALPSLPAAWNFSAGAGGFVRGPTGSGKGELAVRRIDGDPVLAWETVVRTGEDDAIMMAVAEGVSVRELRFRARSTSFPAVLRVSAGDGAGLRYAADAVQVPLENWVDIVVSVSDLKAIEPGSPPLRKVITVSIEDVTGLIGSDRGGNTLHIDDVELR